MGKERREKREERAREGEKRDEKRRGETNRQTGKHTDEHIEYQTSFQTNKNTEMAKAEERERVNVMLAYMYPRKQGKVGHYKLPRLPQFVSEAHPERARDRF